MVKKVVGHKDAEIKRLQYKLDMAEADRQKCSKLAFTMRQQRDQTSRQLAERTARFIVAFLIACPGSFVVGGFYLHKLMAWWF